MRVDRIEQNYQISIYLQLFWALLCFALLCFASNLLWLAHAAFKSSQCETALYCILCRIVWGLWLPEAAHGMKYSRDDGGLVMEMCMYDRADGS